MDIVAQAVRHLDRRAVIYKGQQYSYQALLSVADTLASRLAPHLSKKISVSGSGHSTPSTPPPRVGLFAAPGPEYVAGSWAIWKAGGIVVPLATSHPPKELEYVFQDAGLSAVLSPEQHLTVLEPLAHAQKAALQVVAVPSGHPVSAHNESNMAATTFPAMACNPTGQRSAEQSSDHGHFVPFTRAKARSHEEGALIIYTSGTTGKPKGVLHTHGSLLAQVRGLCSAWRWAASDHIVHTLPLHHIHGIVNALHCAHHVGAAVEFLPKFSPASVWQRLQDPSVSVFMGVPTMYSYLLSHYDSLNAEQQASLKAATAKLRLTVCGSSACPMPVLDRWRQLSGQSLLERYGMTEVGMALSNPYEGERRAGAVGLPLPGVEARLSSDGEVLLKGATLFKEYWGKPEATQQAFDADGWFKTGDTGSLTGDPPYYSILGRTSADIIKSGGYKISALQIESALAEHPGIAESAVLGVPDEVHGEVIAALVATRKGSLQPSADELQAFCRQHLAPYQVPRIWTFVDAVPRNAMGKVNKKALRHEFFSSTSSP